MNITVNIKERRSWWQVILDLLRRDTQVVNYGKHIHFKPNGSSSDKIQVGSILLGWHLNDENKDVYGSGIVEKINENKAYIKLINYTQF